MNLTVLRRWPFAILASALAFVGHAEIDAMRVIKTQPTSAWREPATLSVTIVGSGFDVDSVIRFIVAGTDELGGIVVKGMRFVSSTELVAVVEIEPEVVAGAFDVEVRDALGDKARAKSAFVVEPYSWADRFGCSGAESWRRRIPCRRGTIN